MIDSLVKYVLERQKAITYSITYIEISSNRRFAENEFFLCFSCRFLPTSNPTYYMSNDEIQGGHNTPEGKITLNTGFIIFSQPGIAEGYLITILEDEYDHQRLKFLDVETDEQGNIINLKAE